MHLVPLEIPLAIDPVPPRVATFLASARVRIDRWFARPEHQSGTGFVPSDYEQVWHALTALLRQQPDARRLLDWGSGFGVVPGLGALLGLDANGIEIDGELVAHARELLAGQQVHATIAQGSFVPDAFVDARFDDLETRTVLGQSDAYAELGRDLDEFDLVFAYPWPTEEDLYCEIFRRCADYGAVLLTWSLQEGARAYRKVARSRGR